jgi:hypothetical protein
MVLLDKCAKLTVTHFLHIVLGPNVKIVTHSITAEGTFVLYDLIHIYSCDAMIGHIVIGGSAYATQTHFHFTFAWNPLEIFYHVFCSFVV